jgi:acetyltransferase-like isoleucine patch superfamily enzyme
MNLLKKIYRFLFVRPVKYFQDQSGLNIAPGFKMGKYHSVLTIGKVNVDIADNVQFREFCSILVQDNQVFAIGQNVFFNNYCSISCLGNITIGKGTIFGESVKLYDHNHEHYYNERNEIVVEAQKFKIGSIKIGKNCWIGSNVTILNNVDIGDNVIIGANNLIYKSIPANTIVKATQNQQITTV